MVTYHFRRLFEAQAFAQLQRYVARTGTIPEGYVWSEGQGVIQAQLSGDVDVGQHDDDDNGILEERDGEVYVRPINERLELVAEHLLVALDETPTAPDSPLLKGVTIKNIVGVASSRSSIWTLLPVVNAAGQLIDFMLVHRGQSLDGRAVGALYNAVTGTRVDEDGEEEDDFSLGSTANAQMTDELFLAYARKWLPKVGATREEPGIVVLDGHTTHVQEEFMRLAREHHIYVVVEPSHTSMFLQGPDNGINKFLKATYATSYTAQLAHCSLTRRTFDLTERFLALASTIRELKAHPEIIRTSFKVVGLLDLPPKVHTRFPPYRFRDGAACRDDALPDVNPQALKQIMSPRNFARKQFATIVVDDDVITPTSALIDRFEEYAREGGDVSTPLKSFGYRVQVGKLTDDEVALEDVDSEEAVVRRLFRLAPLDYDATTAPSSPGRIPTAFGSHLTSAQSVRALRRLAAAKEEATAAAAAKAAAKAVDEQREAPLRAVLVELRYIKANGTVTATALKALFRSSRGCPFGAFAEQQKVTLNAKKDALVQLFLDWLEQRKGAQREHELVAAAVAAEPGDDADDVGGATGAQLASHAVQAAAGGGAVCPDG